MGLRCRAVARSEIFGELVVLGGDNVSPLVEIGLADLPNIGGGGLRPPQPPPCDGPDYGVLARLGAYTMKTLQTYVFTEKLATNSFNFFPLLVRPTFGGEFEKMH